MCNSFSVKEREEQYFKNKLNMYWLFRSVPSSDERRGLDWESTLAAAEGTDFLVEKQAKYLEADTRDVG